MLLNAFKREVVLLWILFSIGGSLALARVDNNWSRRPNVTAAQHQGYRPGVGYQPNLPAQWNRPNQTYPQPNNYRPVMPSPVSNTRPQQSVYGHAGPQNQSRPSWQQPNAPSYSPHPVYNQTRPNYPPQNPQPNPPPQQPQIYPPNSVNSTRPVPSAPLLPQPYNNPVPAAHGSNGIPLVPLQPAPQGPHNWHSGGQAVLSYGPGHYPSTAGQTNKNSPAHQGSSNPYANMFI
ncbi:uncharacterized protein ACRADG_001958 isoform 2-T2 [Cochliomyia hominivorax]